MKKHIIGIAAATLALAFTACEDVPAPYGINTDITPAEPDTPAEGVILDAAFSSSLGSFTAVNTEGNYSWAIDGSYGYVKVTSYDNATQTNNKAQSWLVSPKFSLKDVQNAHVTFDYILRYANASELKKNYLIRLSKDYNGDPAAATWTDLTFNPVQVADWNTWTTADVDVPADFAGQENLTLALYYKADSKAATWELKNFKLLEGQATGTGDDETVRTLPYSEAFATSLGGFKNYTTSGSGEWVIDYSTAKATGYDNASQTTTAGTYYLVSPEISLEGQTEAHVAYEYILRYDKGQENQQILITTNFDKNNPAQGWTLLNGTHTEGTDWTNFEKADIDIPAQYMGQRIRIALRYNTNDVSGSTWEVKNFSVASGKAGGSTGGGDTGEAIDPSTPNGGFEAWVGNTPVNWTTATSAGNATLAQSNDAHSGKYSVEVTGAASANKRLGYTEQTLPAGEYTMTFYAKAATSAGASVRPGYVPVTDGKVGSYLYGDYVNDLSDTEWTLVTHTFTLSEPTTLNLVIMNSKNPGGNVLIDDFTLVDGNGKVYIQ